MSATEFSQFPNVKLAKGLPISFGMYHIWLPREPWSYKFVGHELKPRFFPPAWWVPWVFPPNPGIFKKHFPEGPEKPISWNCTIPSQQNVKWGSKDQDYGSLIGWNDRWKKSSVLYSLWMPLDTCRMDGRDPIHKLAHCLPTKIRKHSHWWHDFPMQI